MRLLICGSRGWHDRAPIDYLIGALATRGDGAQWLVVIHGKNPKGADKLADTVARQWGAKVIPERADWKRYGKGAGPIRNAKMLADHDPDVAVAFRSLGKSSGTDDMVTKARNAGVPTFVVNEAVTTDEMAELVHKILTTVQTHHA